MSSCFLSIALACIAFSLELLATISHLSALVKCKIYFSNADKQNIIAYCKKRHDDRMRRSLFSLLVVAGLVLPFNIDLLVDDYGHDAEEFEQRNSPVMTVI